MVVKTELAELHWLATLLFASIGLFILISLILLIFAPSQVDPDADNQIWVPKKSPETFGAFCTIMVAYGYQINIFPIYDSLEVQTTSNFKKS